MLKLMFNKRIEKKKKQTKEKFQCNKYNMMDIGFYTEADPPTNLTINIMYAFKILSAYVSNKNHRHCCNVILCE